MWTKSRVRGQILEREKKTIKGPFPNPYAVKRAISNIRESDEPNDGKRTLYTFANNSLARNTFANNTFEYLRAWYVGC